MLDIILKLQWLERKPAMAMLLGILFPTVGMIFGTLLFPGAPSFPTIFLTTLAAAPVMIRLLEHEKLDMKTKKFLKRNENVTEAYLFLFLGMAIAFAFWFAMMPVQMSEWMFTEQLRHAFGATGAFTFSSNTFFSILANNMGLLFFFFLLALFYGSGSIFLLTWNASIAGIMWGNAMRALLLGNTAAFAAGTVFPIPYMITEIVAYLLAAIAGGIVAVHLHTKKKVLPVAMKDSMILLGISIVILIAAAAIESIMLSLI
jgi:hypothetical protein